MRVEMLAISAGPDGVFPVGTLRDLDDVVATALVDGGYAKSCDAPVKAAPKRRGKTDVADAVDVKGTDGDTPPADGPDA